MLPYITLLNRKFPMYAICMVIGILLSSYIACRRAKKSGKDENSLIVIVTCAVVLGLIGAKLLYMFVTHGFVHSLRQLAAGNLSLLAENGLVFYGGLIGGIAGAFLGAWIAREKISSYFDAAVPCIALGHAFGRLGCFFAGCCYGMPCEGPLCVSFPAAGIPYATFPVQLLEMAINLGIFAFLSHYTGKANRRYNTLALYLVIYAVVRFILEFFRGDLIRGFSGGLSTSQWISIGLFVISGGLLLLCTSKGKERT